MEQDLILHLLYVSSVDILKIQLRNTGMQQFECCNILRKPKRVGYGFDPAQTYRFVRIATQIELHQKKFAHLCQVSWLWWMVTFYFQVKITKGCRLSTAEAEYVALSLCVQEVTRIKSLLEELRIQKESRRLLCMRTIRVQLLLQRMMGIKVEQSTSTFIIILSVKTSEIWKHRIEVR